MTIFSKDAQKVLRKTDTNTAKKLRGAIVNIEQGRGDIVPLKLSRGGMKENLYRYKMEHYRIIFERGEDIKIRSITPNLIQNIKPQNAFKED